MSLLRPERSAFGPEAWAEFLERIDPDRQRAGEAYTQLRQKLTTFFRFNGFWEAEDLVDETIDRVIRRLGEIEVNDLMSFVRGVARHVASESHRGKVRHVPLDQAAEAVSRSPDQPEEPPTEDRLGCLHNCINKLGQHERELMLLYYQYEGGTKVEARRRLAESLGVSVPALRVRSFRIRQQLQHCVETCIKGLHKAGTPSGSSG